LPVAPELAQRLQNYRIDERARDRLRRLAPIVEPVLGPAIDQVIAGAAKLSRVTELWQRHGADIRRVEMAQFQALLRAELIPPISRPVAPPSRWRLELASRAVRASTAERA
jgi:hypothetical protein